jgi:endogenous inhibitor of DNA gyrase (YacG/DUF329 family)
MARAPKKPGEAAEVVPLRPARKCPICGKPAVRAYYPFDSKRCAEVDLSRWLTGKYVIPGAESAVEEDKEREDGED